MRPLIVVVVAPDIDGFTGLFMAAEPVLVQTFLPELSIQAFNEGILRWFRLDPHHHPFGIFCHLELTVSVMLKRYISNCTGPTYCCSRGLADAKIQKNGTPKAICLAHNVSGASKRALEAIRSR